MVPMVVQQYVFNSMITILKLTNAVIISLFVSIRMLVYLASGLIKVINIGKTIINILIVIIMSEANTLLL